MTTQKGAAPRFAWHGPIDRDRLRRDLDYAITRIEVAHTKVCGLCGREYEAWMDLDEWVCELCVPEARRL